MRTCLWPDFRVLRENTAIFVVLPANIGVSTPKNGSFSAVPGAGPWDLEQGTFLAVTGNRARIIRVMPRRMRGHPVCENATGEGRESRAARNLTGPRGKPLGTRRLGMPSKGPARHRLIPECSSTAEILARTLIAAVTRRVVHDPATHPQLSI